MTDSHRLTFAGLRNDIQKRSASCSVTAVIPDLPTARLILRVRCRQVVCLNIRHVTEEMPEQAIVKGINACTRFECLGYRGSGKHALADGAKWRCYG